MIQRYFLTAVILIFISVSVSTSEGAVACPDGYTKNMSSCYKFHHVQLTWTEAVNFCKIFHAHLLQTETTAEHAYIKARAKEIGSSFQLGDFWLAMSDAVVQGRWIWTETGDPVENIVWGPNEPHNRPGEDCAGLAHSEDYDMADYFCGRDHLHAICEIELEEEVTVVG